MSIEQSISDIRKRIDAIDDEINILLAKRAGCAIEIKRAKGGTAIYRPEREAAILQRVEDNNDGALPNQSVRQIFTEIVTSCRNLEEQLKVSYLGPIGTYSNEAAQKLFGKTSNFIPGQSLREVMRTVEVGNTNVALLPIENSSEGSVIETHKLLLNTQLEIIGEITLPIKHCLLSKANKISEITVVHGHAQALGQCREWLQANLPKAKLIAELSNSQAVLSAKANVHAAAIASRQAAALHKIPILLEDVCDMPTNQTRFIALSKTKTQPTKSDKTSVICTVKDKPGALYELLAIFAKHNISLTRLVSQPHPDHQYAFYVDFAGHRQISSVAKALSELSQEAKICKILGSYPEGANASF